MNDTLSLSAAGLAFIAAWEDFRASVYRDAAGIPTIGYGHRLAMDEPDPGAMTRDAALSLLKQDVATAEAAVRRTIAAALTQAEFDALVSLAFNIGGGAFGGSTLAARLNAGDFLGAAREFLAWDKIRVAGALTVSPGLSRRRAAERDLFLHADYAGARSLSA
ncbi:MAG TPA: lysozyme [Stellaceae bacterium]